MGKERIHYLDLMRIFACFLVVMTHSVMKNHAENGKWLGLISFMCSPSSEMFLMLSGAILLPVRTDMRSFYKRRFLKLLPPMFIWSTFGILLRLVQGTSTPYQALTKFVMMPFKPVEGIYWFLYVMIGLYLFAPIISTWLSGASKRQIEFVLVIWLFNMILPWLNLLIPDFYDQSGSYYWAFCYFGGFLGYWILGAFLKMYPPKLFSPIGLCACVMSVVYFVAITLLKQRGVDTLDYTGNLQIGSVFFIVVWFILLKAISDSGFGRKFLNEKASAVAKYSFGIYLMHIYVVRDGVWHIMENFRMYNHPVIETLIITVVSMILCGLFMKLVSMISQPLAKWMFGLK